MSAHQVLPLTVYIFEASDSASATRIKLWTNQNSIYEQALDGTFGTLTYQFVIFNPGKVPWN